MTRGESSTSHEFEIWAPPFRLPLSNPLKPMEAEKVEVLPL